MQISPETRIANSLTSMVLELCAKKTHNIFVALYGLECVEDGFQFTATDVEILCDPDQILAGKEILWEKCSISALFLPILLKVLVLASHHDEVIALRNAREQTA